MPNHVPSGPDLQGGPIDFVSHSHLWHKSKCVELQEIGFKTAKRSRHPFVNCVELQEISCKTAKTTQIGKANVLVYLLLIK
jgi:hypothetical protein